MRPESRSMIRNASAGFRAGLEMRAVVSAS
jgi:hypothetical protein